MDRLEKARKEIEKLHGNPYYMMAVKDVLAIIDSLQDEPVSEELETEIDNIREKYYGLESLCEHDVIEICEHFFKAGAKWQKEKEYTCYEEAFEDGAKWKKEQIDKVLLSEVLPCFMHGGEADEVVAKLDEVLNQKK